MWTHESKRYAAIRPRSTGHRFHRRPRSRHRESAGRRRRFRHGQRTQQVPPRHRRLRHPLSRGRRRFHCRRLGAGDEEVRRLADRATEAAGGHLDILVNNAAALLMPTPTADISDQLLRDTFAVNVFAPFLLTGLVAPEMARNGNGAIVNIGSITGLHGSSGSAIYSANKAAIHSFTKSWADEYGPLGVRVNAVAPGPISTERQQEFADHVEPMLARLPSRRMSTPEEVAASVVFLASDDAANTHGAILSVDGGWAAV